MVEMICGAAIFATGIFFGMWAVLAGQASARNRTGQKLQDAFLKNMEDAVHGSKNN